MMIRLGKEENERKGKEGRGRERKGKDRKEKERKKPAYQHHIINVENKWMLTKIDPNVLSWLFQTDGGVELAPGHIMKSNACHAMIRLAAAAKDGH